MSPLATLPLLALLDTGWYALSTGRPEQALAIAEKARAEHGDDLGVRELAIAAALPLGQGELLDHSAQHALRLDPQDPRPMSIWAMVLSGRVQGPEDCATLTDALETLSFRDAPEAAYYGVRARERAAGVCPAPQEGLAADYRRLEREGLERAAPDALAREIASGYLRADVDNRLKALVEARPALVALTGPLLDARLEGPAAASARATARRLIKAAAESEDPVQLLAASRAWEAAGDLTQAQALRDRLAEVDQGARLGPPAAEPALLRQAVEAARTLDPAQVAALPYDQQGPVGGAIATARAGAAAKAGDTEAALAWWEAAFLASPQDPLYAATWTRMALAQGQHPASVGQAIATLKATLPPGSTGRSALGLREARAEIASYDAAWLLLEDRAAEAAAAWADALSQASSPERHLGMAEALRRLGQDRAALVHEVQALASSPTGPAAASAEARARAGWDPAWAGGYGQHLAELSRPATQKPFDSAALGQPAPGVLGELDGWTVFLVTASWDAARYALLEGAAELPAAVSPVLIGVDADSATWNAWTDQVDPPFPTRWAGPDGLAALGVLRLPVRALVSPEGQLVALERGFSPQVSERWAKHLERVLPR